MKMVAEGGNQKFFIFLREYGKEREPVPKKYASAAAVYYRKRLCFLAKGLEFNEPPPAKNAQELAERTLASTSGWAKDVDSKYEVQAKASDLANKTKAGVAALWGKITASN